MPTIQKKGLGKGLGSLIPTSPENKDIAAEGGVIEVDINKIEPNSEQPRKMFNEEALYELADSIKQVGIIQPIIVKKEDGFYRIIAGERRWRAARIAKVSSVPVIVKEYTNQEVLQVALIENIQRQDLSPVEEALCYKRLHDEFFFSYADIAEKVGKSRNNVSAAVKLLDLDEATLKIVTDGGLTAGHGKVLLSIESLEIRHDFAEKIVEEGISVKDSERILPEFIAGYNRTPKKEISKPSVKNYDYLEKDLKTALGTKVTIKDGKNKGRIEIEYYSEEELDRIFSRIISRM
ncbi:MAG: ParB/RepB/Spo0J family partition protein [Defluviitaleaceae bacterium]|nr:ParB/RepB/Spo0J family partition protein [Defluviitaleaceae bacterium]